jgi:hypothetical protein
MSTLKPTIKKATHRTILLESLDFPLKKSRIDFRRSHTTSKRGLRQSQSKDASNRTSENMPRYAPFAEVQSSCPDWDATVAQTLTKTADPLLEFGARRN